MSNFDRPLPTFKTGGSSSYNNIFFYSTLRRPMQGLTYHNLTARNKTPRFFQHFTHRMIRSAPRGRPNAMSICAARARK
jgi:hypothetical protein